MSLSSKKCIPCEDGVPPLKPREVKNYLVWVPGWMVSKDVKKLSREFKFKNFKEAIEFVNQVAKLAEAEGHHPDILIHDWNKVRLEISTHAIGGLSENDFILASKINTLQS